MAMLIMFVVSIFAVHINRMLVFGKRNFSNVPYQKYVIK